MKLEQKYFVPFVGVGAFITVVFIIYASFHFKTEREEKFRKSTLEYPGLLEERFPSVTSPDSIALQDFKGKKVIVVFWASWSGKSAAIMNELDSLYSGGEYEIVGALVKDARETAEPMLPEHDFVYIDGTKLFNYLKVPGIPSYFVLDDSGKVRDVKVGYQQGGTAGIDRLFEE